MSTSVLFLKLVGYIEFDPVILRAAALGFIAGNRRVSAMSTHHYPIFTNTVNDEKALHFLGTLKGQCPIEFRRTYIIGMAADLDRYTRHAKHQAGHLIQRCNRGACQSLAAESETSGHSAAAGEYATRIARRDDILDSGS